MEHWIGALAVAIVAALLILTSQLRHKRIYPYLDAFAQAYCEAADHVLHGRVIPDTPAVERLDGGGVALLPAEAQPEAVRSLLEQGIDDYVMQRLRTMYEMRAKAQEHLTGINYVGKKINGVLNRCYDLANLSFSIINDPTVVRREEHLDEFRFFLTKQRFLRTTTLASVVSEECRKKLAAQ